MQHLFFSVDSQLLQAEYGRIHVLNYSCASDSLSAVFMSSDIIACKRRWMKLRRRVSAHLSALDSHTDPQTNTTFKTTLDSNTPTSEINTENKHLLQTARVPSDVESSQ